MRVVDANARAAVGAGLAATEAQAGRAIGVRVLTHVPLGALVLAIGGGRFAGLKRVEGTVVVDAIEYEVALVLVQARTLLSRGT